MIDIIAKLTLLCIWSYNSAWLLRRLASKKEKLQSWSLGKLFINSF